MTLAYLYFLRYKAIRKGSSVIVIGSENNHYVFVLWAVPATLVAEQLSLGLQHGEVGPVPSRGILNASDDPRYVHIIVSLESHDKLWLVTVDDKSKLNSREMIKDGIDQP